MQKVAAFLVCLSLALSILASASEPETFDVPSGLIQHLYGGAMEPDHFVYCDFEVSEKYEGAKWPPAVNVGFSTTKNTRTDGTMVRLSATPGEDPTGWIYELWIYEEGYNKSFVRLAPGRSDSILRIYFARSDDGQVSLRVGRDIDNASLVDLSRLPLKYWHVSVTGVKGSVLCGHSLSESLRQ